jgi:hypothetical protein
VEGGPSGPETLFQGHEPVCGESTCCCGYLIGV